MTPHLMRTVRPLALAAGLLAAATGVLAQSTDATTTTDRLAAPESVLIVTHVDARKCMYPLCGGYFVKAVNQALTRCADGSMAKECHAVELDTTNLGWTPEQQASFEVSLAKGQALVKGALTPQPRGLYTGEVLRLSQAWQAQALHKPLGTFYGVHSTGIVCIKAPCPSIEAQALNTAAKPSYPDVNLSTAGAPQAAVDAALKALGTPEGILVVGAIVPAKYSTLTGGSAVGTRLLASEFYLPAKP
jgi:hypothetical protein